MKMSADGFLRIAPGRTMSPAYALQVIYHDVKESIQCQDSEDSYKILIEALDILDEHLHHTIEDFRRDPIAPEQPDKPTIVDRMVNDVDFDFNRF